MAGKDYKVQKKAKEPQRLSVFQPAFRWGGNNNNATTSSSSGSGSKIEPKKSNRLEANKNDKLVDRRRQNERVDQPRRNDNRLAIQEDQEAKMARDAKRMTTFQPMFSSLFSSKPSTKGKGPEPPQLSQAQRPLANGQASQPPSRNQIADPARHGAPTGADGSSKGGRSGSGYQNVGINSKRNEAAAGSSGRNKCGGLAPVPEVDSPRPKSPLQRNPAITKPDDDMMPLGISNPFGPVGRAKGKANGASNGLANKTAYASTSNTRGSKSNGQDRGINNVPSSLPLGSRDVSTFLNQKGQGINTEQNVETKRGRLGTDFKQDDRGSASQPRLGETPARKPVESKSELSMNSRAYQQMDGGRISDGKLAQQPAQRSMNLPQLVVTDTSNVPSSGSLGRLDRPSQGQHSMSATISRKVPNQGQNSSRETPSPVRPDVLPSSRTDEVIGKSSKSPLDRIAKTLASKPAQDTRDVALGSSQDESRRGALPKEVFSRAESSKPGLGIFAKNSSATRQPLVEAEPVQSKLKGLGALRPALEREVVGKPSQERRMFAETQDFSTSAKPRADATVSDQIAPSPPVEEFGPSKSKQITQPKSSKAAKDLFRDAIGGGESQVLKEKKQITKAPLVRNKPGQVDEAPFGKSSAKGKLGRDGASQAEEKARPFETSQPSRTAPTPLEPVSLRAEKASQAEKVEPKASRSGWASRYSETTSNDNSQEKLQRRGKSLVSGKEATSTGASRDLFSDQDGQGSKTAPVAGKGGFTFKQRMQEGLGISNESNLLKPLKSKFSDANNQQTSQPSAEDTQALQSDGTTRPYQQADPPMTLEKPVKEFKPYAVSKPSLFSGSKLDISKNKMPFVQEWLCSNNRETPSGPERPQDELFMGVSESNPRPNPSLENTSAWGISQPLSFADSKAKQKSPRDFIVPVSEVKKDRPDPAMTRKPAEAIQPGKTEQDSREYTLVTARSPVNLSSDPSKRGKTETSAVRVVSGIIERPREIEIQKPSQTDKATRPSKRENQPLRSAVEMFDAVISRKRKSTEAKEMDSLSGDATQSLQVANQSSKQEKDLDNSIRGQGQIVDSSETRKLATVDDQEPKPRFADSTPVGDDTTNSPRKINGKETFTSEGTKLSVPRDPASVDADASNKPGLLGRWTGRGKKDAATERTKQSPTNQPSLTMTATPVVSCFTSASNAQRLATQEAPEVGVPAVRSDEVTRKVSGTQPRSVMETPSNDLLASGATQKAASGSLTGENVVEKDSFPSIFKSPISDSQHDVPAPLFMGGHKPVLKETAPKSREGFVPSSPSEAEKQISAKDRPADRNIANCDMLYISQTEKSNVTSPEMPSQEDFFKQMRQSIMFQNADSIKMDVPESTDAATKRKSRRNRNFSISGLQPARETVVPDVPTLRNPEQRSAVGGGNSVAHSDVPQEASSSWLEPTSFEKSEFRQMFGSDLASGSHAQPSMAKSSEEGWSKMQPSAPVLGGQLGAESSILPQMRSGGSERSPEAGLSPSAVPTRVDDFVAQQPSSSSLPSGARVGRTTGTEMSQSNEPNISKIERKTPNVFKPVILTEEDHVDGTKQADLNSYDLKDKSRSPLEPTFSRQRPEQTLDVDRSIPAVSRDTEYQEPNEKVPRLRTTEAERMPLHPAPSSAGIFRRPSFGDEEGLQHPMTTHNLPPDEEHSDPNIQRFFDGAFKSKKTEELALELGSAHLAERELTSDNQAGRPSFDHSVKGIPGSPQTQPPVEDIGSRALKEVSSSPSPVPENTQSIGIDSGLSEVDPRSLAALNTLTRTQVTEQNVNVSSTPMTPLEPGTRGVEYFEAPKDSLTSTSPETSRTPIQEKATDMSSPYSAEIPVLVVEDITAHSLSRNGDTASHSKSPEDLGELEQQWGKPKLNDATISPRMDHGNLGSFATKHREEENQLPQTVSGSVQGKEPSQSVVTHHTASDTNFQDFVKEKFVSPEQAEFMVGISHVNNEFINSDKSRDAQGGVGPTDVLPHRAPEIAMHEDRQAGSDSPSLSAGYLEQAVAPSSFDSTSHQEAHGIVKHGESWAPIPGQNNDHATLSTFHDEPGSFESNEYRDHFNTNQLPRSNVGLINSPQESDPDLSDHILSLYDGSDSVASDKLVINGFRQHAPTSPGKQDAWPVLESAHTKSLSDFHSSGTDNRTSILSIEPVMTEIPDTSAHPSYAKDSWVPGRSASRLSTSKSIAGFSPPALTPTRDPPSPVNAQTENVAQEFPKAAGLKDRLRMFFSKTDSSEPGYQSHAQPVADSSVYETNQSPELFDKPTVLHGDSDVSNDYASPTFETPIDETGHGRDRVPVEGGNVDRPRAEDKMDHAFLSPIMGEEEYPSQRAMSPERHHIHTPHLNEAEEEVSLRSAYSPDPMPAIASPEQRDSPLPTNHDKGERLSPYHDRSLSASPSVPGNDDGHVSHQDDSHIHGMEEFDPQGVSTPRDDDLVRTNSRPDSRVPEPINDSASLRGTPDLDDTQQNWSPRPEEEHNMFNNTVDKMQALDPISPQMEPMSESRIQNEHLPISPGSTAHYASKDEFRNTPMYGEENTGLPTRQASEPEISSPYLADDGFPSGESPMLENTNHWAKDDLEPNQDRYHASPRSDHMGAGPSHFMDKHEAVEIHSPEGESWNGSPVQTGNFSPAVKVSDHESENSMIIGSADPVLDTATTYSDHHVVPNDHFTAEHGIAQDDFDDTLSNDFSVEDYEDRTHNFEHPGANGSSFGNDEVKDEVDNFGGNRSPAQDFLGHHEELGGIESESYPADHQPGNLEGGFDDIGNDRLPTGDFSARSDTFNSPRIDKYHADHQGHEGDFDDFQDNGVPADDFNDHQETFDIPGIERYPADHQSHEGGFRDFQDDSLPADNFNDRPETFDGPRMENYPADQQSHEGGLGNFEDDRHSADDFLDRPETHGSPTMDNYPADHQSHQGEFDDFQANGLRANDFDDRPETFESPMMDSHPAIESPFNDDGFENHHGPASDVSQDDMGGVGEVQTDHYPADGPPSPVGDFEDSGVDNCPNDDFQRNSGTFDSAEMGPADEFPYDTAEPNDSAFDNCDADYPDANHEQYSEPIIEEMPAYDQDHDTGYPSGGVDDFNPGHDDMPYNEGPLSEYGGDQGPGFDQEPEPFTDDNFQGDYPQDGPLDDGHFGGDDFAGAQPDFDGHEDGMDFDNREGDFDEMRGDAFDNQDYGADVDHNLGGDVDHFDGEPGWEGDAEPANFDERGFGEEGEPFAEDWAGDQMDGARGLDEVEEYPMDGGEDYPMDGGEAFPIDGGAEDYPLDGDESRYPDVMADGDMPMGGEAEEYYMGGEGMQSPGSIEEGEIAMGGGEADDYMMGGDGEAEYPMEPMDGGDEFPMNGDEELPIGEMYGEEDRSMGPMEDEEFPMGDGEASPMMDGEENSVDQEDGFPMEGEDVEGSDRGIEDFDGDGDDQFGDDMSDHGSMPEDVEGSDREIEDFDGDGQLEDDIPDHGSIPDEDQGSQFDDGSVDARSLIDEEAGSQIADEDAGSDASDPFDEEPAGDFDADDEDPSPSEVEDREIQGEEAEDDETSLTGEEDVDGEEEQNMDDLYEADVPSIPASPTSTEHDRELEDQDADGQDDEDDIFGEPALQDDLEDLENADPVRLSCLYMQDVGLMSSPSSPTVTQVNDISEQNEAEVEEEQPREPVRFSALYRQSLDWSQALDSSMWENDDEDLPEEDEEQKLNAPILEAVPESAKRESQEKLRMLEVDQEPLTPVAASPLSPRPLETPPPDYDHSNAMEARQLVEEPEEVHKGAEDNGHQQYAVSPRLQPTPPPDQDQSSVSNDSQDDRRDSKGPQTFDEMNLPRRVISPPNTGDDDDDDDDASGPSQASTSYANIPMQNRGRSISQRFSGWWSGGGSSAQVPARPPPLPAPYDSRYGEPSSPA